MGTSLIIKDGLKVKVQSFKNKDCLLASYFTINSNICTFVIEQKSLGKVDMKGTLE